MSVIVADAVWTPSQALVPGWIRLEGERVAAVGAGEPPRDAPALDARGLTVCPGFIDIHIHGAFGADLMAGAPAMEALSTGLPRHGCTGYLATTLTAPWEDTLRVVTELAGGAADPSRGARALGIHLEGPFLNPRRAGMQPVEHMRPPSTADAERLLAAGRGAVRTITIAPELPGGLALAARLAARGVRVAMAHTDASYEEAAAAAAAGVRHVTHCFNAMRPLHHRDPGVVGAALDLEALTAEAIGDGIHVHLAALRLLWRAKGWRRLALVTDAMPGAAAGDGVYRFGGQDVTVRDGEARLADGTLAGSVLTMDRAVRVMVVAGVPPRQAVGMATLAPAAVAGLADVGRIGPGARADLVALDGELRVAWTMVGGDLLWRR